MISFLYIHFSMYLYPIKYRFICIFILQNSIICNLLEFVRQSYIKFSIIFFPEKELIDLFLMKCMRIGFEILDISTFCILRIFCRARMLNCNIKSEDHTSVDSCRNSRNISFTKSYKQSIDIFTDCFEKNRVHHRKCVTQIIF